MGLVELQALSTRTRDGDPEPTAMRGAVAGVEGGQDGVWYLE